MAANELDQILSDSATEVLESMFFTSLAGQFEMGSDSPDGWVSAKLFFRGNPPGSFGVRMQSDTSRRIAASFLGEEEDSLSETQVSEVICELANMLCGFALSRIEKECRFELSSPQIEPPDAVCPLDVTARCGFSLNEGPVVMWMQLT